MQLNHCTDQQGSLEDYYRQLSEQEQSKHTSDISDAMLRLIKGLETLSMPETAWGLTSHQRLCLLPEDNSNSRWPVILMGIGNNFFIEYLMPESIAPWPNASVRGEASNVEQAVRMAFIAMKNSGAWPSL